MPHEETTASDPGGISSIANRVDFEDDSEFGRRKVLATRYEAHRERPAHDARSARIEDPDAAQPNVAQSPLQ